MFSATTFFTTFITNTPILSLELPTQNPENLTQNPKKLTPIELSQVKRALFKVLETDCGFRPDFFRMFKFDQDGLDNQNYDKYGYDAYDNDAFGFDREGYCGQYFWDAGHGGENHWVDLYPDRLAKFYWRYEKCVGCGQFE